MTTNDQAIFISYRRQTSSFIARAIFQDLCSHGYDVFMDVESIDSGAFDQIILHQIAARPHFLVILTPGTVERCAEPGDWLRREIEYAIEMGRNVVPILANNFNFRGTERYLTGTLSQLSSLNGPTLYHEYFDAAMEKLRSRFLKQPALGPIIPAPVHEQPDVERKLDMIAAQPAPTEDELSAEDHFNQGYTLAEQRDIDGAIFEYTRAIELHPAFAEAFNNRGLLYVQNEAFDKALADFTRSIELENRELHLPYVNRADIYITLGDYEAALADSNAAIEFKPDYAYAFHARGRTHFYSGELEQALEDFDKVVRLDPNFATGYQGRGAVRAGLGDLEGSIEDFTKSIELGSDDADSFVNRAEAYFEMGQYPEALADYRKANEIKPGYASALAGLAITNYASGDRIEARRLWKLLLAMDPRYKDAGWAREELNWARPLADVAQKLIAGL